MPTKQLTEEMVQKLKPTPLKMIEYKDAKGNRREAKQVDFFDTAAKGLVLRVSYGNTKTWRVIHYPNGKPKTEKLGRYPAMKLTDAREAARKFLEDPGAALAKKAPDAKPLTFKQVAEEFIRRHVVKQKLRSEYEIRRCLDRYICRDMNGKPRWEDRPFLEIKRGDVASLLDQIEDDHGPRQADMVLAIISKLMRWYQARNNDYVSPVVPGMRRSSPADRNRKRILEDDEISALWNACEGTFGDIVKLLLLTAQRRDKVGGMRWADIVDGEWRIPAEAREKANAGSLRLPQQALDIIEARQRERDNPEDPANRKIDPDNPYVFPSGRRSKLKGMGPFNSYSQRKDELDEKLPEDMPEWTLHDLRRTARSLMARAGVRPDIAERVLGHAIPGVEGVYDRHTYADEKADALNKLAALIDRITNPPQGDNVVAMPERHSG